MRILSCKGQAPLSPCVVHCSHLAIVSFLSTHTAGKPGGGDLSVWLHFSNDAGHLHLLGEDGQDEVPSSTLFSFSVPLPSPDYGKERGEVIAIYSGGGREGEGEREGEIRREIQKEREQT